MSDNLKCKCGCGMDINSKTKSVLQGFGIPVDLITSGARCQAHNFEVGGAPNSDHCKGLAVDIACSDSLERAEMLKRIFKSTEVEKVEICDKHIHISVYPMRAICIAGVKLALWGVSK